MKKCKGLRDSIKILTEIKKEQNKQRLYYDSESVQTIN